MKRFALPGQRQRFLSAFSGITGTSSCLGTGSALNWQCEMSDRFAVWNDIAEAATAA